MPENPLRYHSGFEPFTTLSDAPPEKLQSARIPSPETPKQRVTATEKISTLRHSQPFLPPLSFSILKMRIAATPGALHLTRRQDLLDLEIAAPDLSPYENKQNSPS